MSSALSSPKNPTMPGPRGDLRSEPRSAVGLHHNLDSHGFRCLLSPKQRLAKAPLASARRVRAAAFGSIPEFNFSACVKTPLRLGGHPTTSRSWKARKSRVTYPTLLHQEGTLCLEGRWAAESTKTKCPTLARKLALAGGNPERYRQAGSTSRAGSDGVERTPGRASHTFESAVHPNQPLTGAQVKVIPSDASATAPERVESGHGRDARVRAANGEMITWAAV
jgi:hypothetical protein